MFKTNKGSALLQVLVLSALISTIVVVLLKFSVTRTANMIQTKTIVGSKLAMQSCMNVLAEDEIQRVQEGRPPYFEENATFFCNDIQGYQVTITRKTYAGGYLGYTGSSLADHATGVVRELDFRVKVLE